MNPRKGFFFQNKIKKYNLKDQKDVLLNAIKPYYGRSKIINLFEVRNDFLYNAKHEETEETQSEQEFEQEPEQQSEQELTETIRKRKKGGTKKYTWFRKRRICWT